MAALREGWNQRLRGEWQRRGESGAPRHQSVGALRIDLRRAQAHRSAALHEPSSPPPACSTGGFDEIYSQRMREADEFYSRRWRRGCSEDARRSSARRSPACCGPSSFITTTSRTWLEGDPAMPLPQPSAKADATATGHISTTPTSSPCRTSGSIPGMRPGTWRFTASRWRWSIRTSPRSSWCCMLREWYMHPNGQIPAYEWAFGDVNPPVHAWAAWRVYKIEQQRTRRGAIAAFLEQVFHKLLLNFTWWVNRKDAEGKNIFQGGFLGLDNIGVFDRSRAAAHRRPHRAVRRHQLDGHVLPEHAAPSRWSWRRKIRPTRTSPASSSSISSTSRTP